MNKYYIEIFNSDREKVFSYYTKTRKGAIAKWHYWVKHWDNKYLTYNLYQLVSREYAQTHFK